MRVSYLRVGESLLGGGDGSSDTLEAGAGSVRCHGVANSAEVLENFLSFGGVSTLLLLRGHGSNCLR